MSHTCHLWQSRLKKKTCQHLGNLGRGCAKERKKETKKERKQRNKQTQTKKQTKNHESTGQPHYNAIFGVHENRPCYK